jgi:hypothetical protein
MVPLEQFDGDIGFVLYSSPLKKSMAATTIGGCATICEGGGVIWRRRCYLEKATRLEGGGVIWRHRHDLEAARRRCDLEAAVVRLGIEGSCAMRDFFYNGEKRDGGEDMGTMDIIQQLATIS